MSNESSVGFQVGEVISTTFSVLLRNIVAFLTLSVILFVPLVLVSFVLFGTADATQVPATAGLTSGFLMVLAYFIFTYVVYGAITYGTVRDLQGTPASLSEILSRGFSTVLPVIGVAIVAGIATGLGFMLFIIPGIIIAVILWVAIPVAVIERPGVFESLSRSADLTKGYRWQCFGIILLIGVISFVVSFSTALILVPTGILGAILYLVSTGFTTALGAVVVAVGYQELRRVKEGVDIETIAGVFS